LLPKQISHLLELGSAWNAEVGYVTKSGYGINLRHSDIAPEFAKESSSLLQPTQTSTLGLVKYFKGNRLRLQLAFSRTSFQTGKDQNQADMLMQVVF
jgi:hypothetical protein